MTDRQQARATHPARRQPDHHADLTDAITRAQHGDEQAFCHLYRTVQPRLLNYARALVGETDAEDVTADTWTCIIRDLHSFKGDSRGFFGWSATIIRHRAADHLRRRKPVTLLPNDRLPERTSPFDTPAQAEETFATTTVLSLVAALPKDQAQAILLRVIMGLDTTTAAHILGKRTGAVRTAAYRGLRALTRRLGSDPPADHAPRRRSVFS